jgi:hypothetical protein
MSEIIGIFSKKISLNDTNLGAHVLFLTFFDYINFQIMYFISKMIPKFWQLATTPILKIQ